jgi:hypothetical protein
LAGVLFSVTYGTIEENIMPYVCRQLELGRSGSVPESMVKWEGTPIPAPHMYYRTLSTVAYAEFCAPGDILNSVWTDVVACAIRAAETVGIARIIADPDAVVGVFEAGFKSCLIAQHGGHAERIQVSLSVHQKPNKEWHR